jgi:hypothetical protein
MKATGPLFDEVPVGSNQTNECCEKISDKHFKIDGEDVTLPLTVADASMMMNAFLVDSSKAQAMIADSGFRVVELFPGKAILQLLCVDYRDNPLGNYNEGAIMFPVLTPGESKPFPFFGTLKRMASGQLSNFVYRMPVNQGFTTHGGRFIWGFPKWVSEVGFEFGQREGHGNFTDEGELVYSMTAKTGGSLKAKPLRAPSLAIRDGRAWKTFGTSEGSGLTFTLGGKAPEIGEQHPLAKELRALGLPKKPMFSISMKQTKMVFDAPEVVNIGEAFSKP